MIGDHEQLRPQLNVHQLSVNYKFNVSLFERMAMNEISRIKLNVQMRMSPQICDLVRNTIYLGLMDDDSVKQYPNVKGVNHNLFWIDHNQPEDEMNTSKFNTFEAIYVVELCKYLVKRKNPQNGIVILTPYAAQFSEIKKKMENNPILRQVRIAILDTFQGEESDIILLSMVRSNPENDCGFLAIRNRISVLLSRAKYGFYIVGNIKCLLKSKIWEKVFEMLEKDGLVSDVFEINCEIHGSKKITDPNEFKKVCC
jgi:superfamily I DNA and/or RNA helicase